MSMAKDHYLPAALIGRFSSDSAGAARTRRMYYARRGMRRAALMKAENVGYQNSLYFTDNHGVVTQKSVPPTTVDPFVNGYEPALPKALDALESPAGPSWAQWLRTLVPYIASLFARGQGFTSEFRQRPFLQALGAEFNTESNANN